MWDIPATPLPTRAVSNIPLSKPRRSYDRELLAQLAYPLRGIGDDNHRLLYRRSRDVRRAIEEELGIELARAGDTE
jgi:hypothetical protein